MDFRCNKSELPQEIYSWYLHTLNGVKLSKREVDIIACTLSGRSAKGTAQFLSMAPKTVESHSYKAMKKLGCTSRESLIALIENNDAFHILKHYYLKLLSFHAFEQSLQEITKLENSRPPERECHIAYWDKEKAYFFQQLKIHLEILGISISLKLRKEKGVFSEVCQSARKGSSVMKKKD